MILRSVTRGASKKVHLHSQTVQADRRRNTRRDAGQFRKVRLSWRKSTSSRRSLGWIPFKRSAIYVRSWPDQVAGQWLSLWTAMVSIRTRIRAGNVCEDARGRWYLNACVCRIKCKASRAIVPRTRAVGIDLGSRICGHERRGRNCRPRNSIAPWRLSSPLAQRAARRTYARESIANRERRRIPASVLDSCCAWVRHHFSRQCKRLRAR